jgi:hypothetical protein
MDGFQKHEQPVKIFWLALNLEEKKKEAISLNKLNRLLS